MAQGWAGCPHARRETQPQKLSGQDDCCDLLLPQLNWHHLQHGAQACVQVAVRSPRRRLHDLSGQPGSVLHYLRSKDVTPDSGQTEPLHSVCATASCTGAGCCWKKPGSVHFAASFQVSIRERRENRAQQLPNMHSPHQAVRSGTQFHKDTWGSRIPTSAPGLLTTTAGSSRRHLAVLLSL